MSLYIPSSTKTSDFCLPHKQNISLVKSKNLYSSGMKKSISIFFFVKRGRICGPGDAYVVPCADQTVTYR